MNAYEKTDQRGNLAVGTTDCLLKYQFCIHVGFYFNRVHMLGTVESASIDGNLVIHH